MHTYDSYPVSPRIYNCGLHVLGIYTSNLSGYAAVDCSWRGQEQDGEGTQPTRHSRESLGSPKVLISHDKSYSCITGEDNQGSWLNYTAAQPYLRGEITVTLLTI
jgi:hypothetical protein